MSGISPYCCCCPPECIAECPEGYEVRMRIPSEHQPHITDEFGPQCAGGASAQFDHFVRVVKFVPGAGFELQYEITIILSCAVVDDKLVWTLSQSAYDWVQLDFHIYTAYTATNKHELPCNEEGLPQAGIVDEWDIRWITWEEPDPPPGFPLPVEIIANPLP